GLTTGSYSILLSHVGTTSTATNIALNYGDSVAGEISEQHFEVVYTFRAARGDVVTITMQRISGDLDSYLLLADAQGNVLIQSDDDPLSPGTLDAAITNYRIEKTGAYAIVATRFGRAGGKSKGNFALNLEQTPIENLGKTSDQPILVDYNTSISGS